MKKSSNFFSKFRKLLGKTQQEISCLLFVSVKGIQSFDQGWRSVPDTIERQILLLLYLKSRGNKPAQPCWKIKKCPAKIYKSCPAFEFKAGHICWFIGGTLCNGSPHDNWEQKFSECCQCECFPKNILLTLEAQN